jgi:hypothetical protein
MSQAQIDDFEALRHLRLAIVKFVESARAAISDAESDIQRTLTWLEAQQVPHWQTQIRRREDKYRQAVEALRQRRLYKDPFGKPLSDVDERVAMQKAKVALEHAQHKLDATRRAIRLIQNKQMEFKGSIQRLITMVYHDMPESVARIKGLEGILERYAESDAPGEARSMAQSADIMAGPKPTKEQGNP